MCNESITIPEQSSFVILSRVTLVNGSYITQSTCTSISVSIYNLGTQALVTTLTPTVSNTIFNTLQKDNRWAYDELGYNFALPLNGSNFTGQNSYKIEVLITPTDGFPIRFTSVVNTENLLSI